MTKILPFLSDDGITRQWVDHEDGKITITETQDVAPLIEANRLIQNNHDGYTKSRDMQFIGRIPANIIKDYADRGINLFHPMHEPELRALLNDPDYRGFRTGLGHIGPKHRHI
jgi:hypothetical protein